MPAEWVSTRPVSPKSFINSILNAEEEVTWHADLILSLAEYHVSRLYYFLKRRCCGRLPGKWGHCAEPKEGVCCVVQGEHWFLEKVVEIPDPRLMEHPREL